MRHVKDPIPDPRAFTPDLDAEFVAWLMWLLAKSPSERAADPAEAWDALEPIVTRLAGQRWRREAALLDSPSSAPTSKPLTPAPFRDTDRPGEPPPPEQATTDEQDPAPPPPSEPTPAPSGGYATFEPPPPLRPPTGPVAEPTPPPNLRYPPVEPPQAIGDADQPPPTLTPDPDEPAAEPPPAVPDEPAVDRAPPPLGGPPEPSWPSTGGSAPTEPATPPPAGDHTTDARAPDAEESVAGTAGETAHGAANSVGPPTAAPPAEPAPPLPGKPGPRPPSEDSLSAAAAHATTVPPTGRRAPPPVSRRRSRPLKRVLAGLLIITAGAIGTAVVIQADDGSRRKAATPAPSRTELPTETATAAPARPAASPTQKLLTYVPDKVRGDCEWDKDPLDGIVELECYKWDKPISYTLFESPAAASSFYKDCAGWGCRGSRAGHCRDGFDGRRYRASWAGSGDNARGEVTCHASESFAFVVWTRTDEPFVGTVTDSVTHVPGASDPALQRQYDQSLLDRAYRAWLRIRG